MNALPLPGAALASTQPQRPQPSYAVAYVFNADPTLPIFSGLLPGAPQVIEASADGGRHTAVPADPEGSSRNETPDPPVPPAGPDGPGEPPAPQRVEGDDSAAGQDGDDEAQRQPLPRGEAEKRAKAWLEAHPDEVVTPGKLAKLVDARGLRDAMTRLHTQGFVEKVSDKPVAYRWRAQGGQAS